jgi:hypothetical protein
MKPAFPLDGRAVSRPFLTALALAIAFAPLGCNRKAGAPHLLSIVQMGDAQAQAQAQLVSGFYPIEAGAWRWTKQNFSVLLAPPSGAAQKGAWLRVRVTAPEALIAKMGTVTLAASVNGQQLPPETYSAAGTYTYERDAPANLLQGASVKVDFALDKVMPPAGPELRDLGIVVLSAGLDPK